jgi:hypothetical protein
MICLPLSGLVLLKIWFLHQLSLCSFGSWSVPFWAFQLTFAKKYCLSWLFCSVLPINSFHWKSSKPFCSFQFFPFELNQSAIAHCLSAFTLLWSLCAVHFWSLLSMSKAGRFWFMHLLKVTVGKVSDADQFKKERIFCF